LTASKLMAPSRIASSAARGDERLGKDLYQPQRLAIFQKPSLKYAA
jgi:hypothetical protein